MRLLTARQEIKKNNGRSPLIDPYAGPINVRYFSITCRLSSAARLVNAAEELSKAHETLMLLVLTYTF